MLCRTLLCCAVPCRAVPSVSCRQDPNTRATLLDKLKATVAVAQEAIKV